MPEIYNPTLPVPRPLYLHLRPRPVDPDWRGEALPPQIVDLELVDDTGGTRALMLSLTAEGVTLYDLRGRIDQLKLGGFNRASITPAGYLKIEHN